MIMSTSLGEPDKRVKIFSKSAINIDPCGTSSNGGGEGEGEEEGIGTDALRVAAADLYDNDDFFLLFDVEDWGNTTPPCEIDDDDEDDDDDDNLASSCCKIIAERAPVDTLPPINVPETSMARLINVESPFNGSAPFDEKEVVVVEEVLDASMG